MRPASFRDSGYCVSSISPFLSLNWLALSSLPPFEKACWLTLLLRRLVRERGRACVLIGGDSCGERERVSRWIKKGASSRLPPGARVLTRRAKRRKGRARSLHRSPTGPDSDSDSYHNRGKNPPPPPFLSAGHFLTPTTSALCPSFILLFLHQPVRLVRTLGVSARGPTSTSACSRGRRGGTSSPTLVRNGGQRGDRP